MPQVDPVTFGKPIEISTGWSMLVAAAGQFSKPLDALSQQGWIAAVVPGTAEQALRDAVQKSPQRLHDCDVWYHCIIDATQGATLRFKGLATIATIYIDGREAARCRSMFEPVELILQSKGSCEISICFHALNKYLSQQKGKRARWRTSLVDNQALRFVRTTFLGHMSGWCPPVDIVGPYRAVTLTQRATLTRSNVRLSTRINGAAGLLRAEIASSHFDSQMNLRLICAGVSTTFERSGDAYIAELRIPDIEPWMPNTHGKPMLYETRIELDGVANSLGDVGFRDVRIDRGADGTRFTFIVNGQRIFARGVCWTPADIVSLPCTKATYARELSAMREAGINMIRVPGITLYEADAFFEAADEFGIMIWQDLQLANFDYPFADSQFAQTVRAETETFLARTSSHCSLVALCSGSEIMQQAAMMGMPESIWQSDFLEKDMRSIVAQHRPDIIYVENSPIGGVLPFSVNHGVAHYYGVGAYMRPLEDARRADVAFAAECLAFSNVPEPATLRADMAMPSVHQPNWKERIPRDRGACWDFEDVREHYMNLLYGVECTSLRRENPARYLAFARAAPAEVIESVFAEWRRPGSRTSGGLVFLWKDLWPGAGWGVMDSTGRPKSTWYAMQRAFQPVTVGMTDEGINGLQVYVLNETPTRLALRLTFECLAEGVTSVVSAQRDIELEPHASATFNAVDLIGAFYDVNYAYRFGPPTHDVVVVRLHDAAAGTLLSEVFHFPLGRGAIQHDVGLKAELLQNDAGWSLAISCGRFAQSVAIDDSNYIPAENYFHLMPGVEKRVSLRPFRNIHARPSGDVSALNGDSAALY